MKNILLFVIISAAVIINSGCSSKLMSFEKRRYNKGYQVNFAAKKDKRALASVSENLTTVAEKETKEIITTSTENTYSAVPEINTGSYVAEEVNVIVTDVIVKKEKNKFFQNPILKHFTGDILKVNAKHNLDKLVFKKNTAGTNQIMQFNFFTFLGALIGGACLIALAVMLFSNWASVTLLIAFVSGCLFGLILLIIGANT